MPGNAPPGTIVQPGAAIVPTGEPTPGTPPGGAQGNVLGKASATDYDVAWIAAPPPNLPGGQNRRVLVKLSDADNDFAWGGAAHFDLDVSVIGKLYSEGGLDFGSVAASNPTDLTRHISLWSYVQEPGKGYGLNITGGRLNLTAYGGASDNTSRITLNSAAQPQIGDKNGGTLRDIIDTTNGDARYALKAHGDHVAANHGHSNYSATNHGHARFDGVQWGNTSYLCQNPGNTEFAVRNAANTGFNWAIAGNWITPSTADLKANIADLTTERAVEAFDALRPVTFDYRDPPGPNVKPGQYGFVVEDMAQHPALASVVVGDYGYVPDSIIPILVAKIRQLEAELDDLHAHTSNPRAPRRRRAK
jgi:hypothetical protein